MKKILSIALLAMLIIFKASAQGNHTIAVTVPDAIVGIKFFNGTWAQALELSKKENKMIFIDCNTTWCVPCKMLARDVFTQKKVADFYNANFINISMDMEKGDGLALAKSFNIKAYPTLAYVKPGGFKVYNTVGTTTADSLIINGKIALSKIGAITLDEQFFKGPRTAEVLKKYFTNMVTNGKRGDQVAPIDTIIKQEGLDAFYQKKYWDIIPITNIGSSLAIFLVENHEKFAKIYGTDAVNQRLAEMYAANPVLVALTHAPKGAFENYKKFMADHNMPEIDFINAEVDFFRNCKSGNLSKAFDDADKALASAKPWQYYEMAKLADYLTVGQTNLRLRANKWAVKAAVESKDKELQQDALKVVDDLMNSIIPSCYPGPQMYGMYV